MHRVLIAIGILAITCACGQKNGPGMETSDEIVMSDAEEDAYLSSEMRMSVSGSHPAPAPVPQPDERVFEKKIIKTGHLSMESGDLTGSRRLLDSLVKVFNGYTASDNFNDQGDRISYNLTCRIPTEQFDDFLSAVESGPDRIMSKSVNARDVSEQYYDVKTRLENERQVEKRYLELLNRANTVKDILAIEENLGKIRQEIEAKEGRLRFLDSRVSYSVLNIYIYQKKQLKYEPTERDRFGQRLVKNLHRGWQGFVDVLLFLLKLWPLWLAGIGIWRFIVWLRRRARTRSKS